MSCSFSKRCLRIGVVILIIVIELVTIIYSLVNMSINSFIRENNLSDIQKSNKFLILFLIYLALFFLGIILFLMYLFQLCCFEYCKKWRKANLLHFFITNFVNFILQTIIVKMLIGDCELHGIPSNFVDNLKNKTSFSNDMFLVLLFLFIFSGIMVTVSIIKKIKIF